MAMELKHLNPQHVMDVTGKAIDEISRLRQENERLKGDIKDLQDDRQSSLKLIAEKNATIAQLEDDVAFWKTKYNDMDIKHTVHIAKMNAKIEELEAAIEEKDCDYKTVKLWNENATKEREELYERITELEKQLESVQATAYAESVDAGMRERRLRRLLWHAIALFCARSCEYFSGIMSHCLMGQNDLYERCEEKKNKYLNAMYKCRAKAEKFK